MQFVILHCVTNVAVRLAWFDKQATTALVDGETTELVKTRSTC